MPLDAVYKARHDRLRELCDKLTNIVFPGRHGDEIKRENITPQAVDILQQMAALDPEGLESIAQQTLGRDSAGDMLDTEGEIFDDIVGIRFFVYEVNEVLAA